MLGAFQCNQCRTDGFEAGALYDFRARNWGEMRMKRPDGRITRRDVEEAASRIRDHVHRTPVFSATSLGDMVGVRVLLKGELFQKTGSFKARGVFNRLLSLSPEERARGFVSISGGNHAAALAYGASLLGSKAAIVMPTAAVQSKIDATRSYGGEVVLTEGDLLQECRRLQDQRGAIFVHPFDDLTVIAGQGTVGLEVVEDVPDLDAVIVPVGGGGLISGVATVVKAVRQAARVIGVEPEKADAVSRALVEGRPLDIGHPTSIADGLAAPFAGEHTLAHIQSLVDEVVRVGEEDIAQALRHIYQRAKLAAEGAGAAAFAALLSGAIRLPKGALAVCVVSGGNIDPAILADVLR
jgi:threonine dehydratase